jgi:ion channel
MISAYLMSAVTNGRWTEAMRVVLFTAVALLAIRNSLVPRRIAGLIVAAVLAGSAVMLAVWFIAETGKGIANIWAGLVLLFAVAAIMRRTLAIRTVTLQNIYGAISAYLIIGVAFASFFAAIGHLNGGHFFAHGQPGSTQTFQYFSFTTLATVGYGDFTAAGSLGRAMADLEALTGQIFLVTLVAFLVARFRTPGKQPPDQPAPRSHPAAINRAEGIGAFNEYREPIFAASALLTSARAGGLAAPHHAGGWRAACGRWRPGAS